MDSLSLTGDKNIAFSHSIFFNKIDDYIISFIEHPVDSSRILAVTPHQLLSINPHGECEVLAGVQLQGCTYRDNIYTFTSISHILYAEFSRVKRKDRVVIADQSEHCLKSFTIDRIGISRYSVMGKCRTAGTMQQYATYTDLSDTRLTSPTYLAIAYFSDVIRLIINCNKNIILYPVIISFYSQSLTIHDYYNPTSSSGYVTGFNSDFYYPTFLSSGSMTTNSNADKTCEVKLLTDSSSHSFTYICNGLKNSIIPVDFGGLQLIIQEGELKRFVVDNNIVNLKNVIINHMPVSSSSKLSMFTVKSDHKSLLLYSRPLKVFYYINTMTHHKYHSLSNSLCDHDSFQAIKVISLDSCAYTCATNINCRAFSFVGNTDCYLHSSSTRFAPYRMTPSVMFQTNKN
ncbi:hypothetical protein EB796_008473 [Bugula neritina]|uniref:Apple domain-containing protein n=1 Tax=Bugula neritina TaxID=10212 RepID=A0A7J7K3M1_BUGNE|nr:hypothetical protein EB796_008473 [Bugula neritina]